MEVSADTSANYFDGFKWIFYIMVGSFRFGGAYKRNEIYR